MSICLVIAGGPVRVVGPAFVFVKLAVISGFELTVPTPRAPAAAWLRRPLARPRIVPATALTVDSRPWDCA